MVKECLPQLMSLATGSNLNTRHGSILAIAEIIHRLAIMNDGHSSFEGIIGEI